MDVRTDDPRPGAWLIALGLAILLAPVAVREARWAYHDQGETLAGDYHVAVYSASQDVLKGQKPYGPADSPKLGGSVENYPPTIFVALTSINWLPWRTAAVIWLCALAAMVVATPIVLGVRDPPSHVVWLFSAPVLAGMLWGNVTLAIIFAAALAWRWRDRPTATGLVLGAAIATKFLAAPLVLWLLATRRFRAAAVTAASALALLLASWAAIGFAGVVDYPELIKTASRLQLGNGLLLSGLASHLGAGATVAGLAGLAVALALASAGWARRHDDRACLALMVLALQFATPIYHVFNLGFLVIPIALLLSDVVWAWLVLTTVWFVAHVGPLVTGGYVNLRGAAFGTAVVFVVTFWVLAATQRTKLDAA